MNPNLFKSAEFYHRRHHNFATFLILPSVLLVSFLVLFLSLLKRNYHYFTRRNDANKSYCFSPIN